MPSFKDIIHKNQILKSLKNFQFKEKFQFKKNKVSDGNQENPPVIEEKKPNLPVIKHKKPLFVINEIKSLKAIKIWFSSLVDCLIEFCEVTGLHGASHITRYSLPKYDRFGWFCVVIIAILVSGTLLHISWNAGDDAPTRQIISSLHDPIYMVPFPAVSICSTNRISKMRATALAQKFTYPNMTVTDILSLFKLSMGVRGILDEPDERYILFGQILKTNNYTLQQFEEWLTPDCSRLVSKCIFKGVTQKCEALFQEVDTSFGKCCSFNYFGKNKTTFPLRVILRNEMPKVPQRVTSCSKRSGLTLLLEPKVGDYFATYYSHQGVNVFLHDPFNFPDENMVNVFIPVRSEGHIQLAATQTFATDDVRSLEPSVRKCLFWNERKLKYMQRYSMHNCYAECRSDYILKLCGCVPSNLPRNDSIKLCETFDIPCVLKYRQTYVLSAMPGVNLSIVDGEVANLNENPCDCIRDCELNQYSALPYATFLDRNFSYSFKDMFKNVELIDQTLLHIYFDDLIMTRYRISVFQTWVEILASFGGLLGFVMGFSIYTAWEFLFLTLISPILNQFNV